LERFKSKRSKTILRYIGNASILVGYYCLLFLDQKIGLIIRIVAPIFFLPSCIELKLYDILFITGIFLAMDIAKLVYLLTNK
jgi:hypothetical protein